jgi:hypothetical protein
LCQESTKEASKKHFPHESEKNAFFFVLFRTGERQAGVPIPHLFTTVSVDGV